MLILLSANIIALANDDYIVGSEDVIVKQGESVVIPIELTNNKGIMGMRLTVKYPKNQLELTNISSGVITKGGLFNTTVNSYEAVNGTFDMVWSTTEDVDTDGTIMMLTFKASAIASNGKYSISLSYSQEDTFNEKWQDVKLQCSPITVTISDGTWFPEDETTTTTTTQSTTSSQDKVVVSDDYLIASVKSAMNSFSQIDIDSLTDDQKDVVLQFVNNRLLAYDSNARTYDSFEELRDAYKTAVKNETVQNIVESTNGDKIIDATESVLKENNADSFAEIPDDKKKDAVDKAIQNLAAAGADTSGFANVTDIDEAAEILDQTVEKTQQQEDESLDPTPSDPITKTESKTNIIPIIIGASVAVVAIALALFLIIKKKRRNTDEK